MENVMKSDGSESKARIFIDVKACVKTGQSGGAGKGEGGRGGDVGNIRAGSRGEKARGAVAKSLGDPASLRKNGPRPNEETGSSDTLPVMFEIGQ